MVSVKCKRKNSKDLSYERKSAILKYIHYDNSELDLDIGKLYKIFGIVFRENVPWFYVDAYDLEVPIPLPFDYFDPFVGPIPASWRMVIRRHNIYQYETQILPEYWATNPAFYERLADGDEEARRVFKNME